MSIYDRPTFLEPINTFNTSNWVAESSSLDINFLNANYLRYPTAQGDQTYTSLAATGNLSVAGNTTANTLQSTAVGAAVNLYNTTTTGTITVGSGLTTGRLKIGTTSNSNHIGNFDFTSGNNMNNVTPTTGNMNFGNGQTTGTLNIGNNSLRTAAINIATTATTSSNILIGSQNTTIDIRGSTITINGVNQITANAASNAATPQSLANGLPSPYFLTLTGSTAIVVNAPTVPALGNKIIIYNSNTTAAGCTFAAASSIIVAFGSLISSTVTSVNMPTNETTVFQWNGTLWIQQYRPNFTNSATVINYFNFTPTGFNQIGYSQTFTSTPAATITVGNNLYTQQFTGTFPTGLYYVAISNRITAGTTAGNVINGLIAGLSSTTATSGLFATIRSDLAASNTTLIASGVATSQTNGLYSYTGSTLPYNLLSFNIVTVAGTGIQPLLTAFVMRMA